MTGVEAPIQTEMPVANADAFVTQEDTELGAVWDRVERDNGSARDDSGKFASTTPVENTEPLEGGEGGDAETTAETSTPAVVDVPLPSNWQGKADLWAKVPSEIREPLRQMQEELHQKQSQLGRELSQWKPVGEVINKYSDYFGGARGNYKPNEAIDYLFNLQKQMDDNPVDTLLQIADTYELRPMLAQMFAGQSQGGGDPVLLAEIAQLKTLLSKQQSFDPSVIDQRLDAKLQERVQLEEINDVMKRVQSDMPLINEVDDASLEFYINKAWSKLGDTASREAVLRMAGDMAINADPDLRVKAAAVVKPAAGQDPTRVAAAKRANETNIRSTSPEKGRKLTDEEELGQIWEKNQRA